MRSRTEPVLTFLAGVVIGAVAMLPRACAADTRPSPSENRPVISDEPLLEWHYLIGPDWATDTFRPTSADYEVLTDLTCLILKVNPDLSIAEVNAVAGTLLVACDNAPDVDPMLLAQIARYESTFNPYAVNRATGCYGMMQWMKRWHKGKFTDAGLNWDSPTDQCRMAAERIQASVSAGKTIRQALAPWAVRDKAIKAWEAAR